MINRDQAFPSRHDGNKMTRRELMVSLSALLLSPHALAQTAASPIRVRTLNHVHLIVSNLQRSLDFYQRLFGMPLAGMQGVEADWKKPVVPMLAIGSGPQFISFSEGAGRAEGRDRIDHFGFGLEKFDADRVLKMLSGHAITGNVRMRADSVPPVAELKFTDPDNITVQIQDVTYCGGSGALGARCANRPAPARTAGPPVLPVRTLNHLTLAVSDVARSVSFYQRVLGMRTQFTQATEADWKKPIIPVLGIGGGPQFLAFSAARQGGGRIDHFCLGMERFSADRVVKILAEHDVKANVRKRADSDPPSEELTFTDPDNIRVQIQDVSYCGGKGILGSDCKAR